MLVSLVVDPRCFGPEAVVDDNTRKEALRLLQAVIEDGAIFVAHSAAQFCQSVADEAEKLGTKLGQRIQKLAEELLKGTTRDRCVVTPRDPDLRKTGSITERLCSLAKSTRTDLIVCPDSHAAREFAAAAGQGIEVCDLPRYSDALVEQKRTKFASEFPLHSCSESHATECVGRAVRYGDVIVIADKMLGRKAKNGKVTADLRRFAKGVIYLAAQWHSFSPFADRLPCRVELVTLGWCTGSGGGDVNPAIAAPVIKAAIEEADAERLVQLMTIEFKQDDESGAFNERVLGCAGRAWRINHGLDDLGRLTGPAAERRFCSIDPDSQANRDRLAAIRRLRSITKL